MVTALAAGAATPAAHPATGMQGATTAPRPTPTACPTDGAAITSTADGTKEGGAADGINMTAVAMATIPADSR